MKLKLSILFSLLLLVNIKSYAQFDFYAGYQGIYDDNIYNNYLQISDYINSFSFGSAFNIESEFNNVQLYYEGSLSAFQKNTFKNFDAHRIGLVETHLFSIDDNPLNAGINFSFRNNRDDFKIYDFNQLSVYINYRYSVSSSDFIIPGYVYNRNNYKNFSLFSHNEHKFFLTWSSSFQTGTSLMFNAEYNLKKYFETYDYTGYLNEASQIKFMTNVSQSLAEKTGMNAYVVYRKNLSDGSRYLLSDSLIYYEEEIFNDIYSYDGIETGLGFKHYLSDNVEFNAEAKYIQRNYSNIKAVDKNGYELDDFRKDDLFGLGAGISIDLHDITKGLSFSATWNYINNDSNDYYYKYTNQMISFSLDYGF